MKKLNKLAFVSLLALPLLSGCDFLQGTLSSSMSEKLAEETGSPSYAYKSWYYNGTSSEDMSSIGDSSSTDHIVQSLQIDFGKKVAVKSLSGSLTVYYTDSDGNDFTKVISSVSGRLSSDYTSFLLDMSPVIKLFDTETVASGTASVDIKLGGFVCAEGDQKGRSLSTFELSKLQIKPLYNSVAYTYSTSGYDKDTTKFLIPLNADVSLDDISVAASDTDSNTYDFNVSIDGTNLYLIPDFDSAPSNGTVMTLAFSGILPEGAGDSYEKEITATFIDSLIVIDGIEDANYTSSYAVSASDASDDSITDSYAGASDLTEMYVANDADYFYVALKGALTVEWYDGLVVMISKDHTYDASSAAESGKEGYGFADTVSYGRESLAHGKPDFYLFDREYDGTVKAYVEDSGADTALDISSYIEKSDLTDDSFIEFAIPLTQLAEAGIVPGDTVYVIGGFSAHWDEGVFFSDAIPDAVSFNTSHSSATVNFQNGLEFELNTF